MPRWAWESDGPYCFMDIETQSTVNIKTAGGKVYIHDPSTRLLSSVWLVDDRLIVWIPAGRCPAAYRFDHANCTTYYSDDVPDEVRRLAQSHVWVAHNAETFDAVAWARLFPNAQPRWVDTLHLCRLYGWPGGLDAASKAMGGAGKADTTSMKLLTSAKVVNGRAVYPVGTKPLWDELLQYNIADVTELKRIADEVLYNDHGFERVVQTVSSEVNERGMYVDLPFARKLRDCWTRLQQESCDEIARLTGGGLTKDNIRSPKQVKEYLTSLGFHVPSLNSATVNQILNDPEGWTNEQGQERSEAELAIAVLAERQNATRSTVGKLDRLFSVVDADSCVRNIIQYHGAGTGRYSGRDLQPHNFPRGVLDGSQVAGLVGSLTWDGVKAVADATKHPNMPDRNVSTSDVLASLTRSVLRARPGHKLIPVDFSAVEARGIAWVARCDPALAVFADIKQDIYCDMASKLYGRTIGKKDKIERGVGKIIVLGCGYGMGAPKFGMTCRVLLVDLTKAGVTEDQCVAAYRGAYPEIPAIWRSYGKAAEYVVKNPNSTMVAGRCLFGYGGGFMWIELPSGRRLRYRNARIEWMPPKWEPNGKPIPQIVYQTPYGFSRTLYGGLIAENIVQAICRDILCDCLVKLRSFNPVLHVHDEIVFEVAEDRAVCDLHTVSREMAKPPSWARDFPLGCEGNTGIWYSKSAFPGEEECKYLAQA